MSALAEESCCHACLVMIQALGALSGTDPASVIRHIFNAGRTRAFSPGEISGIRCGKALVHLKACS